MSAPFLIFGATGGVGSALAAKLHAKGLPLVLSGRSEEALSKSADQLGATALAGDVTREDDLTRIVEEATNDDGLAGLAFCVGSIDLKPLRRISGDDLTAAFQLNAVSAALAIQKAAPALKKAKGSVVL
ncbi:MAG: SDR family oxidoreductase, partial [Pseudomonadota bacterium]